MMVFMNRDSRLAFPTPMAWPVGAVVLALGLGYWLAFLLALLPDNLHRAAHAGMAVSAGHEALRIAGAALLGALVTPAVWALTRRFPVALARRLWRHLAI